MTLPGPRSQPRHDALTPNDTPRQAAGVPRQSQEPGGGSYLASAERAWRPRPTAAARFRSMSPFGSPSPLRAAHAALPGVPPVRAYGQFGPSGPAAQRRATSRRASMRGSPSVQHCRASVPGDALQARRCLPDQSNPHGGLSLSPVPGTAADQAEPAMVEAAALLVGGARSQLAGQLGTPGQSGSRTTRRQCRVSRKAALSCAAGSPHGPRPEGSWLDED